MAAMTRALMDASDVGVVRHDRQVDEAHTVPGSGAIVADGWWSVAEKARPPACFTRSVTLTTCRPRSQISSTISTCFPRRKLSAGNCINTGQSN